MTTRNPSDHSRVHQALSPDFLPASQDRQLVTRIDLAGWEFVLVQLLAGQTNGQALLVIPEFYSGPTGGAAVQTETGFTADDDPDPTVSARVYRTHGRARYLDINLSGPTPTPGSYVVAVAVDLFTRATGDLPEGTWGIANPQTSIGFV